ncbi:2482_t:CDS:2, partial [Racocetra fulgida]
MNLTYILLLILQLFAVFAYSYSPIPRSGHLSAFINNKLYFIGGSTTLDRSVITNDFFYIDCSVNFNSTIESIPYKNLSDLAGIPSIDVAGSSIIGPYNDIILTFGGIGKNNRFGYQLIYTFDTRTYIWKPLTTNGIIPPIRKGVRPIYNSGRLYAFGGFDNINGIAYNYIDLLDIIGFTWSNNTLADGLSGRDGYGSALLPDGNILYLGGYFSGKTIDLNIVSSNHAAAPTLAVLDLTSEPFKWISQTVSGDSIPPPLLLHTANVVNNYMIIAY